jgi:Cytochrome b(C-terminal)/b6/petD
VLVWPDLVYTELICMIAATAILLAWGILLQAPLEEPASSVKTPNPSKAPWYFLGLQEMLVYYDPWYAGVVLPSLIIFGLMAIPFLDFNRKGNGYYTINERKFSYLVFQFGFLELWVTLIILGTFLRGPNWNFFGPFEYWDVHKVEVLENRDLSQYFWIDFLGRGLPKAPQGSSLWTEIGYILVREAPGIIAVLLYFILLPPLLAVTVFRKFFVKMGFLRYMLMSNLLLFMLTLPIKMVLRWTVNLKYIISIPEYFLNF